MTEPPTDCMKRVMKLGFSEAEALGRCAAAEAVILSTPPLAVASLAGYQAENERLKEGQRDLESLTQRYRDALVRIARQDYRGPRPHECAIADEALKL